MDSLIPSVPWRLAGHVCHLHADEAEAAEVLVAYLQDALADASVRVICAASASVLQQVRQRLDLDEPERTGRLTLVDALAHYANLTHFDPERVVADWLVALDDTLAAGYSRLCLAGDMPPQVLQLPGGDRLIEYEARFDLATDHRPVTTLCQYSRRDFAPELLQQVVLAHPHVIVDGCLVDNLSHVEATRLLEPEPQRAVLEAMLTNIRDAAQSRRALQESEERHRLVADYTADWETWYSPDAELLYVSPSCERITGYSREEFMADPELLHRLIHPDHRAELEEHLDTYQAQLAEGHIEARVIRKDGAMRWISHVCQPVWGPEGRYLGRRGSNRDVTQQKEAELRLQEVFVELQQQQRRMTAIFENAGVGIAVAGPDGRLTGGNAALAEFLGTTPDELIGKTVADITHPDDLARDQALLAEVFAGERTRFEMEKRYVRADGEVVWGNLVVTAIRDVESGIPLVIGMLEDIDARKRAEAALQRVLSASQAQAAELNAVIAAIADGVSICDREGRLVRYNEAASRMLRYGNGSDRADYRGRTSRCEYRRSDGTGFAFSELPLSRSLRGVTVVGEIINMVWPDGSSTWVNSSSAPVFDAGGDVTGAVLTTTDITAQREAQRQIAELAAAAQRRAAILATTMAATADGLMVYTPDGMVEHVSEAGRRMLHYTDEELQLPLADRVSVAEVLDADLRPLTADELPTARALGGEVVKDFITRVTWSNGSVTWFSSTAAPVLDGGGQLIRAVVTFRDITAQWEAENALRRSREDFARAGEVGQLGWWRLDSSSEVLTWSEETYRIFGADPGTQQTYETFVAAVHADDRDHVHQQWSAALGGEPYDIEHRITVGDTIKWVREKAYLEFGPDGQLLGGFGIVQDITARKEAQAHIEELVTELQQHAEELTQHRNRLEDMVAERTRELVRYQDDLRRLAAELSRVEEQERQRIATAIHDQISQPLAFLRMQGHAIRQAPDLAEVAHRADALDGTIGQTIQISRRLTMELSPPVLYEMAFDAALQWLGDTMEGRHGYSVHVRVAPECLDISQDLRVMLFRSTQEVLTNAAKHAGCRNVWVDLHCDAAAIDLTIRDDGRGFDPAALTVTDQGGFGLFSIQERAAFLGGELHVSSSPGEGATFRLLIPLDGHG